MACVTLPIMAILYYSTGEEKHPFSNRDRLVLNCIVITDPPRALLQLMQTVSKGKFPL